MNDVMRQAYRELTKAEKNAMQKFKADAGKLYDDLSAFGNSRETSLAKTKLEESVMWAVKHITGAGIGDTTNLDSGGDGQPGVPGG